MTVWFSTLVLGEKVVFAGRGERGRGIRDTRIETQSATGIAVLAMKTSAQAGLADLTASWASGCLETAQPHADDMPTPPENGPASLSHPDQY